MLPRPDGGGLGWGRSPDFRLLLREEERYPRYLRGLVRSLTDRVIELSTLGVQNRIRAEMLRLAHAAADEDGFAPVRAVACTAH